MYETLPTQNLQNEQKIKFSINLKKTTNGNALYTLLCGVIIMEQLDVVRITKCTKPEYIGFVGKLYTNLMCFHANANIFSMPEILAIDKNESCIGIIGNKGVFWWTEHSEFDVEISVV